MKKNEWLNDINEYFKTFATTNLGIAFFVFILCLIFTFSIVGPKDVIHKTIKDRRALSLILISYVFFVYNLGKYIRYKESIKAMKKERPTKEAQEMLRQDFAESDPVCKEKAKIGKDYVYIQERFAIIPINQVTEFIIKENGGRYPSLNILAVTDSGIKSICSFGVNDEGRAEAQESLDEANSILKRKKEETS